MIKLYQGYYINNIFFVVFVNKENNKYKFIEIDRELNYSEKTIEEDHVVISIMKEIENKKMFDFLFV